MPLVSDDEAAEMRKRLDGGVRGVPVLLKWLEQLLGDRATRIRMLRALVGWPSRGHPNTDHGPGTVRDEKGP